MIKGSDESPISAGCLAPPEIEVRCTREPGDNRGPLSLIASLKARSCVISWTCFVSPCIGVIVLSRVGSVICMGECRVLVCAQARHRDHKRFLLHHRLFNPRAFLSPHPLCGLHKYCFVHISHTLPVTLFSLLPHPSHSLPGYLS